MTEKTALIMEGGAMRGMFTCGVFDVFLEQNITFDGAAGISAGACFGCNFKSKQIGRPIRYNMKYCRDPRYCSIRSLIRTGDLFGVDFCYRQIPEVLDPFDYETFENNPMEFYIGAMDVHSGQAVYHKCTDGREPDTAWMRASASMPIVSRPVQIDGHTMLDGGVVDSVPYEFMEKLGFVRNVIILTRPAGYRKEKSSFAPLIRLMLGRYPRAADALANRHIMYNRQMEEIEQRERDGISLVIRPPGELDVSRTESNADKLKQAYDIGRAEALRRLKEIREFLHMPDNK